MINFAKKTVNTDKFRNPAIHFKNHGVYCFAPPGTTEYVNYWEQEQDRCINGYFADDGDWISGYHYFYLNYCPILRLVEVEITDRHGNKKLRREKQREFPDFYDYDYNYFLAIQEAEEEGKHLVVLKKRGAGYSFKGASMLVRNYYHIAESKSYAIAAETEYLVRDGLLSKAWDLMDFLDEHTAWAKKRTKTTVMHRRSGVLVKDEFGNETEVGYKSEIIGVTLKNDPNRARGKRGKLILWEEAGCHIKGTKVMLSNGRLINVEDVVVGDELMGPDGTPRKVLERHTGIDHMYRITPKNGHEQIVNSRHIIYGHKQDYYGNEAVEFEMTPVQYMEEVRKNPKRKYHYSLVRPNGIDFDKKDTIIDPYVMGLWLGDGDSRQTAFSSNDKEVIDFLDAYAENHGLYSRHYPIGGTNCISIHLTPGRNKGKNWMLNELKRLGILNKKDIHDDYIYTDRESRLKLLAGLIDTDGSYSKEKRSIEISQHESRKHIIDKAAFIARSLGMRVSVSSRISKERALKGKIIKGGEVQWRLIILNGHEEIPTLIKRKQSTNRSGFLRNENSTRFDVSYYGVDEYYGFTVDKDHLFLIDDFTIVHNSFKDILQAWQIARPSVEEDGVAYGLMVAYGTGGDEGSRFDGLKEMFYNPSGYNIKSFDNIWDEAASGTQCGFFVPVWANMSVLDDNGDRLYMDKDGNSLRDKAVEYAMSERQKVIDGASDTRAIDRYVAENPMTPQEACLELTGNIFPKKELMAQLSMIRVNKKLQNHKQVGDLIWVNGELNWQIKKHGDITKYPLGRDDNHEGSIVIWEHPMKDAPHGLYIAGCLTPGEKVLTNHGLKNVEKVDHNDLLINEDGEPVKIKVFQKRYKEDHDTYRVTPYGSYRSTNFTEEHPILINNTPNNILIDSTKFELSKNLKVGDWLKIPNRYRDSTLEYSSVIRKYFGGGINPDNPLLWWFIGVWIGDGFNNRNGKSHDIYVAFGINQTNEALRFDNVISSLFNRKTIYCKSNGGNTRRFTHKALFEFLENEFGKYSYGKRLPEWVKHADANLKKYLLSGYLDSDGSAFYDRGRLRVNFTSINLELLESFQDILYSLGIFSTITAHSKKSISIFNNREYISNESFRLSILRKYIKEMIPAGFEDFMHSEKMKRIIDERVRDVVNTGEKAVISSCGKYIYIQIAKIEKSKYTGTVYNFECDTHTYMCRNIVTHNCDPLTLAVRATLVRIGQNR